MCTIYLVPTNMRTYRLRRSPTAMLTQRRRLQLLFGQPGLVVSAHHKRLESSAELDTNGDICTW